MIKHYSDDLVQYVFRYYSTSAGRRFFEVITVYKRNTCFTLLELDSDYLAFTRIFMLKRCVDVWMC